MNETLSKIQNALLWVKYEPITFYRIEGVSPCAFRLSNPKALDIPDEYLVRHPMVKYLLDRSQELRDAMVWEMDPTVLREATDISVVVRHIQTPKDSDVDIASYHFGREGMHTIQMAKERVSSKIAEIESQIQESVHSTTQFSMER